MPRRHEAHQGLLALGRRGRMWPLCDFSPGVSGWSASLFSMAPIHPPPLRLLPCVFRACVAETYARNAKEAFVGARAPQPMSMDLPPEVPHRVFRWSVALRLLTYRPRERMVARCMGFRPSVGVRSRRKSAYDVCLSCSCGLVCGRALLCCLRSLGRPSLWACLGQMPNSQTQPSCGVTLNLPVVDLLHIRHRRPGRS